MARTKASVGAKVSSGKSSKARCSVAPPSNSGSAGGGEKSSRSYSGGNPVCPRETPKWQKSITNFLVKTKEDCNGNEVNVATSSKSKPRRNVIESDEEEALDAPKNKELDETIELEPLTGENSHKIDEYYLKNKTKDETDQDKKGKGKGKKSNKENVDDNVRRNLKRELDESIEDGESRKKIKT